MTVIFNKGEILFSEGTAVTTVKVHKRWDSDKDLIVRFAWKETSLVIMDGQGYREQPIPPKYRIFIEHRFSY